MQSSHFRTVGLCFLACKASSFWSIFQENSFFWIAMLLFLSVTPYGWLLCSRGLLACHFRVSWAESLDIRDRKQSRRGIRTLVHLLLLSLSYFSEGELQHKSLPIWLRKELEELELRKIKEAERNAQRAEMIEGQNTARGSWRDELEEDDDIIERVVVRNKTPPNYRKRSRSSDSPPERV